MPLEWSDEYPPGVTHGSNATDYSLYTFLIQIACGIQERYKIVGGGDYWPWPQGSTAYDTGLITTVTDNGDGTWTITDESEDPTLDPPKDWGSLPKPFTTGDDDWAADSYDIVIWGPTRGATSPEEFDVRYTFRASIIDTTTNTLTINEPDWIRLKHISEVEDLEDCYYQIIDHRWASDPERWPDPPVDVEYFWGKVAKPFTLTISGGTSFTLTVAGDETADLSVDADAGEIAAAIRDTGTTDVRVFGSGPFTILFKDDVDLTADGATVDEPSGILYPWIAPGWAENYWSSGHPELAQSPTGFDLVTQADDDKWYRTEITGNDSVSLSFDPETWGTQAGKDVYILSSIGWWIPERRTTYETFLWVDGLISQRTYVDGNKKPFLPYQWYRGILDSYIHHNPDDTLAGFNVAATSLYRSSVGDVIGFCDEANDPALDNDIKNGDQDVCSGESRKVFSPHLYKTLRGWQVGAEGLLGPWIERKNYAGKKAIPYLNLATWMKLFLPGSNYRTVVIEDVDDGDAVIDIDMPTETSDDDSSAYDTLKCVWALIDGDDVVAFDPVPTNTTVTSTRLHASNYTFLSETAQDDVGRTLVIIFASADAVDQDSAGWSRWWERKFQFLYAVDGYFVPTDNHWPASPEFTGNFVSRPASSTYCEATSYGKFRDTSKAFVVGEAARFIGSAPPTTDYTTGNPDAAYEDHVWIGRPGYNTGRFVPTKSGSVTPTGTFEHSFCFTDSTAVMWEVTNGYVHALTASSGSTTTIADDTKDDPFNDFYNGVARDFIGFTIEFLDGANAGEKRLITDYDPDTQTWTFAPPLDHAVLEDDTAQMIEPYVMNWWKGHKITITFDGTDHVTTVTGNDNKTVFVEDIGEEIPAGAIWAIDDPDVGGVWQYQPDSTSAEAVNGWIPTSSPDVDQDERGADWKSDQFANEPTLVRGFGRMRLGDLPLYNACVLKELYEGINKLVWAKYDVSYRGRANPDIEEFNFVEASATDLHEPCADIKGHADDAWDAQEGEPSVSHFGFAEADGPPFARTLLENTSGYITAKYAYAVGTPPNRLARKSELFIYGTVDGIDSDAHELDCDHRQRTFEMNGPPSLTYRQFQKAYTAPTDKALPVVSSAIGTQTKPSWADCLLTLDDCPDGPPGNENIRGWYAYVSAWVVKFNVEDGLRFTDTDDT